MSSKIKSLTIVNQRGTNLYQVGETYNGMELDKILDATETFEQNIVPIYRGWDDKGNLVFETINAPVDVAYTLE
jgi:hypothetical protein